MANKSIFEKIEKSTLRCEYGCRGGGIEISLDFVGQKYVGHRMTAYQNYLGGGILGRVCNDCTFPDWDDNKTLLRISESLKKYFHKLTNPGEDYFESISFEKNQQLPISAY
jgi:hypothetical protein